MHLPWFVCVYLVPGLYACGILVIFLKHASLETRNSLQELEFAVSKSRTQHIWKILLFLLRYLIV
jgi:hypothetical protein